jgi:acetyl esterase/lipase
LNLVTASLAVRTDALIVSVEYLLAPEHPIPATYDDVWATFRWVATKASLSDRHPYSTAPLVDKRWRWL